MIDTITELAVAKGIEVNLLSNFIKSHEDKRTHKYGSYDSYYRDEIDNIGLFKDVIVFILARSEHSDACGGVGNSTSICAQSVDMETSWVCKELISYRDQFDQSKDRFGLSPADFISLEKDDGGNLNVSTLGYDGATSWHRLVMI